MTSKFCLHYLNSLLNMTTESCIHHLNSLLILPRDLLNVVMQFSTPVSIQGKIVNSITNMQNIQMVSVDSMKTDNIFCLLIDNWTLFVYNVFGEFEYRVTLQESCKLIHAHGGKLYTVHYQKNDHVTVAVYFIGDNFIHIEKHIRLGHIAGVFALNIDKSEKFLLVTGSDGLMFFNITDGEMTKIIKIPRSTSGLAAAHNSVLLVACKEHGIKRIQFNTNADVDVDGVGHVLNSFGYNFKTNDLLYLIFPKSIAISPNRDVFIINRNGKLTVLSQDGKYKQTYTPVIFPAFRDRDCLHFFSNGTLIIGVNSKLLFYR